MHYSIRNWKEHFECSDLKKTKSWSWVKLPIKHDGKSFRRIASMINACDVFAAWILILQVAAKMPERGVLIDDDGPLDSEALSFKTGYPRRIFDAALPFLASEKIGWLNIHPDISGQHPDMSGHIGTTEDKKREEEIRVEETLSPAVAVVAASVWADRIYAEYPKKVGRRRGIAAILAALKRLGGETPQWLFDRTRAYAEARQGCDPQYTPYPEKWFGHGRYEDDPIFWIDQKTQQQKGSHATGNNRQRTEEDRSGFRETINIPTIG